MDCKRESNSRLRPSSGPSRAEMLRQATDYLHEDIEDLLNFGATYNEIIERGGFANWDSLRRSLKRRGKDDLLNRLYEKKAASV